jgi:hypothetical protein
VISSLLFPCFLNFFSSCFIYLIPPLSPLYFVSVILSMIILNEIKFHRSYDKYCANKYEIMHKSIKLKLKWPLKSNQSNRTEKDIIYMFRFFYAGLNVSCYIVSRIQIFEINNSPYFCLFISIFLYFIISVFHPLENKWRLISILRKMNHLAKVIIFIGTIW